MYKYLVKINNVTIPCKDLLEVSIALRDELISPNYPTTIEMIDHRKVIQKYTHWFYRVYRDEFSPVWSGYEEIMEWARDTSPDFWEIDEVLDNFNIKKR